MLPGPVTTTPPGSPDSPDDRAPAGRHVRAATVVVDAGDDAGPLDRVWHSIGYDEMNWSATPTGRRLLATFREVAGAPLLVRSHYVFCSGTGLGLAHWGNGNVYHEDADGTPTHDFALVDRAYDAVVGAGHHVLVELGFTPRDLLPPEAAELVLEPSPTVYSSYEAGAWAYPPRDNERWAGLVRAHARHCVDRYGAEEVAAWVWELWNEPDITYWRGTVEQFCELYRVTAAAVRGVLPDARVGGPAVTGGGGAFLRTFLTFTARTSTPLDFVSFHTKGSEFTPWRTYAPFGAPATDRQSPSTPKMLAEIRALLRVVGEFPAYRRLPVLVDECDAGVPAHLGVHDNPHYGFRNTEYHPVFQVKLVKKLLDLNRLEQVGVALATSWAFYFEGERFFEGTRAFLTAGGVEKPFLNAYRVLARLGDRRVAAVSSGAVEVGEVAGTQADRPPPGMVEEVDVLASRDHDGTVAVAVWRHADDQYLSDDRDCAVVLSVTGLAAGRYRVHHLRIDAEHSNSHTRWREQGSPQDPTPGQLAAITARSGLEPFEPETLRDPADGALSLDLSLPLPSVSLVVLSNEP